MSQSENIQLRNNTYNVIIHWKNYLCKTNAMNLARGTGFNSCDTFRWLCCVLFVGRSLYGNGLSRCNSGQHNSRLRWVHLGKLAGLSTIGVYWCQSNQYTRERRIIPTPRAQRALTNYNRLKNTIMHILSWFFSRIILYALHKNKNKVILRFD